MSTRWRYRDCAYLYMLFDYVCGGELFSYLRNAGRFGTNTVPVRLPDLFSHVELNITLQCPNSLKDITLVLDLPADVEKTVVRILIGSSMQVVAVARPPIVPRVTYEGDTRNFDDYPETDWKSAPTVGETEQKLFEDF
uniref:(California timema) hypothetical protein n=1 Tax=Timema californicum TaxID=61474 RepID=A0A7R9J3I3_TIMCA|nr:unnamed protein product [Timema californicum]